jgi:hypothetical protein
VLAMTGFAFLLRSQEITSEKAFIRINNIPVVGRDSMPPVIKLLSHQFDADGRLRFNQPEINILGKITDDKSGINRIFINRQKFELTADGLFMQMIPLVKGENKITIVAVDNEDNYSERNLIVEFRAESNQANTPFNISGKYYALLIGINEYEDPNLTNLDYPVKDAENLNDVLSSYYLFDEDNIILLRNARRADINNALDILARRVTPDDNLLIFYAGHGWWDQKADIGYWLPKDAKREYKADWFRNSTLCDYIREINSKHTLLITDACFGGSIFKTRNISMEASKAIQMLYDLPSRKAMTSGTLTEVPDRSCFVKYLIERLEENKEKCISSEQLFASFRIAVINNSDVIPQYGEIKNVGDEGGDFIFIRRE